MRPAPGAGGTTTSRWSSAPTTSWSACTVGSTRERGACAAVPLPPTTTVSPLALLLPPAPPHLSLAQVRVLLRACLPLPVLTVPQALALIRYHQRHKYAAYQAHRARHLRWLADP